ncbi:MAG: tRNA (N(6)-L-threonylcarbamoyladenosine(37)-C(2))-methylthiotransferase MtaB [Treponema sp.]|jgi:threonylcarbamoyladenosine tRNA methylthiotransferase MtaB|nr:tRNA (N(6)-L-threonylcarbamoyladenosine(37)-C(2))-methylthiotransferase MtaB [Treponema sp.]
MACREIDGSPPGREGGPAPLSFSVETIGCKLNQAESEAIADAFNKAGFSLVPCGQAADILVVNTCTVTSRAEQKARRVIRRALRENPLCRVIVTGCYAQLDAEAIAALETDLPEASGGARRLFVVPGDLKPELLKLPGNFSPGGISAWPGETQTPGNRKADPFAYDAGGFSFHSRAFLKIQDGCDHACAYCRVSLARGKSVSLDSKTVLNRLKELERRGYGEAVLTGVNIGQYRAGAGEDLAGLLAYLLENTGSIALRLSSLEGEGITEEFLDVIKSGRIRPHFHLSIQSGSRTVLERMGRRYAPEEIERNIAALRERKEDPFLACDIIAGFPGETRAEFEETRLLCERADFAWIHAFPYSKRPGTAAAAFRNPVSERETAARVECLGALAASSRAGYVRRWIGRTVEAIGEKQERAAPGFSAAVSENYLRLLVPCNGAPPPAGKPFFCRIAPLEGGAGRFDALGEPLANPGRTDLPDSAR